MNMSMFLTSTGVIDEILSESKLVLAVNLGIAAIILLIGCISAKRFNFLHGFIATLTMFMVLAGISVVMAQILLDNPDIKWLADFAVQYDKYTVLSQILPSALYSFIVLLVPDFELILEQPWIVYIAVPLVLWVVSRIFAGIIRRAKRGY